MWNYNYNSYYFTEMAELISGTIGFLIVDILRIHNNNFKMGCNHGSW